MPLAIPQQQGTLASKVIRNIGANMGGMREKLFCIIVCILVLIPLLEACSTAKQAFTMAEAPNILDLSGIGPKDAGIGSDSPDHGVNETLLGVGYQVGCAYGQDNQFLSLSLWTSDTTAPLQQILDQYVGSRGIHTTGPAEITGSTALKAEQIIPADNLFGRTTFGTVQNTVIAKRDNKFVVAYTIRHDTSPAIVSPVDVVNKVMQRLQEYK